ncbi:uncharacterized protein LOC144135458 isoform X1 [Amblyomma americanum]
MERCNDCGAVLRSVDAIIQHFFELCPGKLVRCERGCARIMRADQLEGHDCHAELVERRDQRFQEEVVVLLNLRRVAAEMEIHITDLIGQLQETADGEGASNRLQRCEEQLDFYEKIMLDIGQMLQRLDGDVEAG